MALLVICGAARGNVTAISVEPDGRLTNIDGHVYAIGWMEGTVPGTEPERTYRVPIEMLFPLHPTGNGVGLVEPMNSSGAIGGGRSRSTALALNDAILGASFLSEQGYVYLAIEWSKAGAELAGGQMDDPLDGYQILRDAASLLRGGLRVSGWTVVPQDEVLIFGYSQTGSFVRGFLVQQDAKVPGSLNTYFDGALMGGSGQYFVLPLGSPTIRADESPLPPGFPAIIVNSEADVSIVQQGYHARAAGGRIYEIAGTNHGGETNTLLESIPIDFGPFLRAALFHLTEWVLHGTEPPPEALLDVVEPPTTAFDLLAQTWYPDPTICESPQTCLLLELARRYRWTILNYPVQTGDGFVVIPVVPFSSLAYAELQQLSSSFVDRDQDGNARGGVRLPHLAAPLGTYQGVPADPGVLDFADRFELNGEEYDLASERVWDLSVPEQAALFQAVVTRFRKRASVTLLQGHFEPFDLEELSRRYPTEDAYLKAVRQGALHALEKGWILPRDYHRYLEAAPRAYREHVR